jgi:hypothetical protein
MIADKEQDISKSEMIQFFRSVPNKHKQSLGLMGGWAVNLLLQSRGVTHIGSRDIDIFFDPKQIDYESIATLIKDRRFLPHSTFRWIKYFHAESGKELSQTEATSVEQFNLVYIYLDLAAPAQLDHVLNEPLLTEVFAGKSEYCKIQNLDIMMPSIEIMTMIKIKSTPERTDSFKREKDLTDLLAMLRNVNSMWIIRNGVRIALQDHLRTEHVNFLKTSIKKYEVDGTLSNACYPIGININAALDILRTL